MLWRVLSLCILFVFIRLCLRGLTKASEPCLRFVCGVSDCKVSSLCVTTWIHKPQTCRDTSRYARLFFLIWACLSIFTVRSMHWVLRDAHHLWVVVVNSNIVHTRPPRWLFAYACITDTHSSSHGAVSVMLCFFIHSLSECTILDTIDPFCVSYAWKHTVTCSLAAMSGFIGALLSCITLLHILWWIGLVRPPPRIRCWQQQDCAHMTAAVVDCTLMPCAHIQQLWTHTVRFMVLHLSWFLGSSAPCPCAFFFVRVDSTSFALSYHFPSFCFGIELFIYISFVLLCYAWMSAGIIPVELLGLSWAT